MIKVFACPDNVETVKKRAMLFILDSLIETASLKIYMYSDKTKKNLSILVLCSPVHLLKHNICALFGSLKHYFACFDCSIFLCAILLSCGIARPVIQAETGVTASARIIRSGQ